MEEKNNQYKSAFEIICVGIALYLLFSSQETRVGDSCEKIEHVVQKTAQLTDYLDASIADIDNKLESIEQRLDTLEDKLNI